MVSTFELALAYTKAGISIIPVLPNAVTLEAVTSLLLTAVSMFGSELQPHRNSASGLKIGQVALAAVLGRISGGLECLDLTSSAAAKLFRQLVTLQGGTGLLERVCSLQARVGGRTRLYYRCPNPARRYMRLAQLEVPGDPGTINLQVLAFVHGEGSWTVLPSALADFPEFDRAYEWVGGDLTQVPTFTEDERQLLLESAGCLNAWVSPDAILGPADSNGFDNSVSWEQILVPLLWKKVSDFGDVAAWQTPERTKPGYCAVTGIGSNRDLLYMIGTGRAYTKFGAYGSFYFGGDFKKAKSIGLRRRAELLAVWTATTSSRAACSGC